MKTRETTMRPHSAWAVLLVVLIAAATGGCWLVLTDDLVTFYGSTERTELALGPPAETFSEPAWSPRGMWIAFIAFDGAVPGGRSGVFIVREDGSGLARLTPPSLDAETLTWSPDGRRILFVASNDAQPKDAREILDPGRDDAREIYVVNVDGTGRRQLTKNQVDDRLPAWSPRGSEIAFASERTGDFEIYTMAPDGSRPQRRTHTPLVSELWPSWSPDGRSIAYTRGQAIVVLSLSSGSARVAVPANSWKERPAWSPAGEVIAFMDGATWREEAAVAVVNIGTGRVRRLSKPGACLPCILSWAPDGRRIVYQRGDEFWGAKTYWIADLRSGRRMSLGTGHGELSWAPDGRRLVLSDSTNGLYVLGADGRGRRSLLRIAPLAKARPAYTSVSP